MKCLYCNLSTRVLESRQVGQKNEIRRRRQCRQCRHRFTTYERLERPALWVIKQDGTREMFKYRKILDGLMKATKKTKTTPVQTEALARDIEKEIVALGKTEIKSQKIGSIVIKHLATVNKVAYLRFVSVYRRLKTVASFEKELISLKK